MKKYLKELLERYWEELPDAGKEIDLDSYNLGYYRAVEDILDKYEKGKL